MKMMNDDDGKYKNPQLLDESIITIQYCRVAIEVEMYTFKLSYNCITIIVMDKEPAARNLRRAEDDFRCPSVLDGLCTYHYFHCLVFLREVLT